MGKSFRQSMSWLHTWMGLVPGWILFVVFLFGTVAFFHHEISEWMTPEVQSGPVSAEALAAADALLRDRASGSDHWEVYLPDDRGAGFYVGWKPQTGRNIYLRLDPATGHEVTVRDTWGGRLFYRFHFDFHYMPVMVARYVVSIAAIAMFIAILSGIVTHKKFFTDFFSLRLGKGQRSWLDAHNILGVLALPFHLMITYTGLVIFSYLLFPSVILANFPGIDAFFDRAYPQYHGERSDEAAPLLSMVEILAIAEAEGNGRLPGHLHIEYPGDAKAIVEIAPREDRLPSPRGALYLNGVTGAVLERPQALRAGAATYGVMIDLHAGRFADPALRWLYFILGVLGTMMIATGLVLWTVKRRSKLPDPDRPHFGFTLVERLNVGFLSALPSAIPAFFLANRLLPVDLPNRDEWEINCLFLYWGALLVWSLARPAKQAWIETLAVGALSYAMVPVVSAFTTDRGLFESLAKGDWVFVGFDLTMTATSLLLAFGALKLLGKQRKAVPSFRRRKVLEVLK